MDNDETVRRADNAARILQDPLWEESWKLLMADITEAAMRAKTDEGTIRGKLMRGIAVDVRIIWEGYIKNGVVARDNIKLDKEQKRGFFRAA